MVDHFSDLTYVHLMRSKIQEVTLTGKLEFEIWADSFGIKIHRYHADNGIFSEQPFRSEIEDSKQTITSFGVEYHHQNVIVEGKIQSITLGASALLLHKKIVQRQQL